MASQVVLVVKNSPTHAGDIRDMGSIPGLGRSAGGGNGNPLQNSCLENLMDREAWWATVHVVVQLLSHVQLFVTPWTVACQALLSVKFARQGYWSGLPFPPPGDLPYPRIEPASLASPALAGDFFTTVAPGKLL